MKIIRIATPVPWGQTSGSERVCPLRRLGRRL